MEMILRRLKLAVGSVEAWFAIDEHQSRSIELPPHSVAGESLAVRPRPLAVVIAARIQP